MRGPNILADALWALVAAALITTVVLVGGIFGQTNSSTSRPGVIVFPPPTKCEPTTCQHDVEDLRFLQVRVTDVRACEFSFEAIRRTGVMQIDPGFAVGERPSADVYVKVKRLPRKGDVGTILYCSACNTALAADLSKK